jgi:hypothetical protein
MLFTRALARLAAAEQDALMMAFAALCNRIGVADKTVVKDRQDLERIVSKATGYLGIALEMMTAERGERFAEAAAARIARQPLVDLFRRGYGAVLALKHTADRWRAASWFQRRRLPLTFWGEQWMGVLGGLLIKRPLYFDNYRSGVIYREFSSLAEVTETRQALDTVIAMDGLLEAVNLSPPQRTGALLTYRNLLLTAWARDRLGMGGPISPLDMDGLRRFFTWLWNAEVPPFNLEDSRREAFLQWLAARAGMPPETVAARFGAMLEALFGDIQEELGAVAVADLHPRYVDQLVLAASAPTG